MFGSSLHNFIYPDCLNLNPCLAQAQLASRSWPLGRWAAGPAGFCVLSASHPSKHMSLSFWLSFKNGKILWKGSTKESWNGNLLSSLVDMKPNKLQYISYGGLHLLAGRHCGFHIKHCFCVIVFWGFMYRFARRNVPCCSTVLQATVLDGSFAILSKWCYVHGGSKLHCSSSMPSALSNCYGLLIPAKHEVSAVFLGCLSPTHSKRPSQMLTSGLRLPRTGRVPWSFNITLRVT